MFLANNAQSELEEQYALLKGKGKGQRTHSTGKGFGRRGNPKDKNGNVMKCHKCGSTEHLQRNCPNNMGGGGSSPPALMTEPFAEYNFAGLQLQSGGGDMGVPEATPNARTHLAVQDTQPWDGSEELPWTASDLVGGNSGAQSSSWTSYPVWIVDPGIGRHIDVDVTQNTPATGVFNSLGEPVTAHQLMACRNWMPPNRDMPCWNPPDDIEAWSRLHPNGTELRDIGPLGAWNPNDPNHVNPGPTLMRVNGPQWAIDAWTKAYVALSRARRLVTPPDFRIPGENVLVHVTSRSQSADPWHHGQDPWRQPSPAGPSLMAPPAGPTMMDAALQVPVPNHWASGWEQYRAPPVWAPALQPAAQLLPQLQGQQRTNTSGEEPDSDNLITGPRSPSRQGSPTTERRRRRTVRSGEREVNSQRPSNSSGPTSQERRRTTAARAAPDQRFAHNSARPAEPRERRASMRAQPALGSERTQMVQGYIVRPSTQTEEQLPEPVGQPKPYGVPPSSKRTTVAVPKLPTSTQILAAGQAAMAEMEELVRPIVRPPPPPSLPEQAYPKVGPPMRLPEGGSDAGNDEPFIIPGDPEGPVDLNRQIIPPPSPRSMVPARGDPQIPFGSTTSYHIALAEIQRITVPRRTGKQPSAKGIPAIYRSADRSLGEIFMNLAPHEVGPTPEVIPNALEQRTVQAEINNITRVVRLTQRIKEHERTLAQQNTLIETQVETGTGARTVTQSDTGAASSSAGPGQQRNLLDLYRDLSTNLATAQEHVHDVEGRNMRLTHTVDRLREENIMLTARMTALEGALHNLIGHARDVNGAAEQTPQTPLPAAPMTPPAVPGPQFHGGEETAAETAVSHVGETNGEDAASDMDTDDNLLVEVDAVVVDTGPAPPGDHDAVPNQISDEDHYDRTLPIERESHDSCLTSDVCGICQEVYQNGHSVTKFLCNHGFHSLCWTGAVQSYRHPGLPSCPMCRAAPYANETSQFNRARFNQNQRQRSEHARRQQLNDRTDSDNAFFVSDDGVRYLTGGYGASYLDGRLGMIVDPGSVWDLAGSEWARSVAAKASSFGLQPSYGKRDSPLNISGVGNGSQQCTFDCHLPVALRTVQGTRRTGVMYTPTVVRSALPGLLGLNAFKKNRAVLDVNTSKLYFLGPGDYDLDKATPPGTDIIQCETAPSGHIILPCCEYDAPTAPDPQHSLTLHARTSADTEMREQEEVVSDRQTRRLSEIPRAPDRSPKRVRFTTVEVPPPPQHDPMR